MKQQNLPFNSLGSLAGALQKLSSNFHITGRSHSVQPVQRSLRSDENSNYSTNYQTVKAKNFVDDTDDEITKSYGNVKIFNDSTNDLSVNLGQGELTAPMISSYKKNRIDLDTSEDGLKSLANKKSSQEYSSRTYEGRGRHPLIKSTSSSSTSGANSGESITFEISNTATNLHTIAEKSEVQSNIIEIENLLVLEEKLQEILTNLRVNKQSQETCLEWWTFSNRCDFHEKIFTFFNNKSTVNEVCSKSVQESTLLEYYSMIICFDACSDLNIFSSTVNLLKNLFFIVHQNFLIVCNLIMNCLAAENLTNVWGNKLETVIISKLTKRIKKGEHLTVLRGNIENISSNFKNIFRTYPSQSKQSITLTQKNNTHLMTKVIYMFKNFSQTTVTSLNDLFKEMIEPNGISHVQKLKPSTVSSDQKVYMTCGNSENLPNVSVPYLTNPIARNRDLTLILDLDETIVHVESDKTKQLPMSSLGLKINIRPYLLQFLEECCHYYEIILFTSALQDYADPVIDYIETRAKKRFFEYRLYRQHAAVMDGAFVKDISKIGRPISKVLIVDNIKTNFKLQKENGILIKSYETGLEAKYDRVLMDLSEILVIIAKTAPTDIRKSVLIYKNEILKKITCI